MGNSARRICCAALAAAVLLGGTAQAAPRAAAAQNGPARTAAEAPPAVLRALAGSGLPLSSFGVYVTPVNSARPLASINADAPYVLASTAKLVTTLAALDLLGSGYRWRTHAFVTGPIEGGKLLGDLMIVGGGDASLSSDEMRHWLQRMRDAGLREVKGDILIDRSAFALSELDHRHTPAPGPGRPHHVWPTALQLDEGVLHLQVQATRGARADVQTVPPLRGVQLVNKVSMGGGCFAGARWSDSSTSAPQLLVEGRWSAACGPRQLPLVLNAQADFTPHAVAGLWMEVGGKLGGRVRQIDLTQGQPDRQRWPLSSTDGEPLMPWSTHLSEPLPGILREMNKSSNNVTARHLMLSLARGFPLRAASMERAQASVRGWLARQGLAEDDIALENGSGLSRAERGKPRALAQLLASAWGSAPGRHLLDSLPVAGIDGTLQHRMQHGAATGRAFLKTGTLLDARGLAGYVQGGSGTVYAVAALVNHPNAARATPALDALIEWLAKNG